MAETTSFPNTLIYECSSANATVNIADNEWVNEFKEGVELKPGDTVRILGSFINEKGSGDQIEITNENNKFTLEYIPIHNLYQYTKLSDGYKMPNDATRTDLTKLQYSQILNFDTPKMYDGNGSQILPLPPDAEERADRWFNNMPWNTYHNLKGYGDVNPNTQYYDCELVKTISCVYVDGIRLTWVGKDTSVQAQLIDFDVADESPWGGPKNAYQGDPSKQLAFGSMYSYFTWNKNEDNPQFTWSQTGVPTGVSGKIIGLKYSVNQKEWIDDYTWAKDSVPIATFMVGDHTIQTKVDKDQINPLTEPMIQSTGMATIWDTNEEDYFTKIKQSPFFNAQNGPVDSVGQTWTLQTEEPDQMTSGFTSGAPENQYKSCLDYNFYNTGPSTWSADELAMPRGTINQQSIVPQTNLYYDATTKKYYYNLFINANFNPGIDPFPDKIYYSFLRAYDPKEPLNTFKRVYLPISIALPELIFPSDGGFDTETTLTPQDISDGNKRYTDDAGTASMQTTSGGIKIGNDGWDGIVDINTTFGDGHQQTIKPGFQTNFNMLDDSAVIIPTTEQYEANPVGLFTRKAGGYPSTSYAEQIEDILDYKQDCWMIQSKKANFEIPTGFYTPDRLANVVNDLLHLNRKQYENKFGEGNITLANKDDNWSYAPGYVNGPFVQTKIPEINGGIIPPDLSEDNLANPSLSNRIPGIVLDPGDTQVAITTETLTTDGLAAETLAASLAGNRDLIQVDKMKDQYKDSNQMIFCPHPMSKIPPNVFIPNPGEPNFENTFKGFISSDKPGAEKQDWEIYVKWVELLVQAEREIPIFTGIGSYVADGQPSTYEPPAAPAVSEFSPDKTGELGEGVLMRCKNIPFGNVQKGVLTDPTGYYKGFQDVISYTNRTNGGLIYGGLSRFFSGANDFTFLYDNDEERFAFSNTYTPFRPAGFESTDDKAEFTVDDAVPSVLINTIYNGYNLYATTQIYILSLAAPPVCVETSNADYRQGQMPTIADPVGQQAGAIDFWTSLGFTDLPSYEKDSSDNITITESRWIDDLYFQENLDESTGKRPILNIADIDPSSNAANPAKSQCLTMTPNRQFLIQTISDELKASNPATLTTYPFYLIGSSIPSGFYHGSDTGTELPVVGLCSRNFSAGSFVFDLSQSSVEWTISENITLTSIRTKILKNDFSAATNLFGNSAIVYAITKNNFYNQIPQPLSGQIEKQREKQLEKDITAYETAPIPIQPQIQYIIPSPIYTNLIEDDSD